ncbi:hypothetical protein KJ855_00900 [Patescibacteria group bacterium]|nr:hypothetical protein [Patescibacteria group bacterium]
MKNTDKMLEEYPSDIRLKSGGKSNISKKFQDKNWVDKRYNPRSIKTLTKSCRYLGLNPPKDTAHDIIVKEMCLGTEYKDTSNQYTYYFNRALTLRDKKETEKKRFCSYENEPRIKQIPDNQDYTLNSINKEFISHIFQKIMDMKDSKLFNEAEEDFANLLLTGWDIEDIPKELMKKYEVGSLYNKHYIYKIKERLITKIRKYLKGEKIGKSKPKPPGWNTKTTKLNEINNKNIYAPKDNTTHEEKITNIPNNNKEMPVWLL